MHQHFQSAFSAALKSTVEDMLSYQVELQTFQESSSEFKAVEAPGIASIVGFQGKISGRCLLWFPDSLAITATNNMLEEEIIDYKSQDVLFTVNEINNMLSGGAITDLNNQFQLSLRLSPPSVFAGNSMVLSTSKIANYLLTSTINGTHAYLNLAVEGSANNE